MADITHVTDSTFEAEVLQSSTPVLVDFWAEWCGPCRQVAPILEELAKEYDGRLRVVKVDTDANPGLTARYGVSSIPTLNVFSGGEVVKSIIGAKPKPILVRELSDVLA